MIAKLFTEVFQKGSRDTTALQTVGLLSAMIFLVNYTFEVLVINGLYPAQHGLIGLMLLALCLWSIVEVGIIKHKQTPIPLTLLTIVLWSQLMVVLVRHTPQCLRPWVCSPKPRTAAQSTWAWWRSSARSMSS